jgi:TatD DNase family protein
VVDSHCHLAGPEFADDLEAVVERGRAAGIARVLVILAAEDEAEVARASRVLGLWSQARVAVGVHPHSAHLYGGDPRAAVDLVEARLASLPAACAIGEIGLDYHYDFSPKAAQQQVFRAQLGLARRTGMPVVLHVREAEEDTLRILAEEGGTALRGVFHCFTGDRAAAERVLATGFFVSIPGIVTFPKAAALRDAASRVPGNRLLIETDSPYLAPLPHRGRRNEPAFVREVLQAVAAARRTEPDALGAALVENFDALFLREPSSMPGNPR